MPTRWIIIDSCYAVVFLPTMATSMLYYLGAHISYFLCCMQKSFPFPLFRMQQIKWNSRHMHAGLEDVTNKFNCLPNIIFNVNDWWSHSALQLTLLVPMLWNLRPFRTSRYSWNCLWNILAENWWWQFCFWKIDSHWKLLTINRPSNLSLLNEKNNGLTTNDW